MSKVASKSSGSAQGSDKGRLTGQGKGPGGWPSKVHDRQSGGGRDNAATRPGRTSPPGSAS